MSISVISLLAFLPGIFVMAAQWIGILALRGRKNMPWWLMLIGVSISTLGVVVAVSFSLLARRGGVSVFGGGMNPGITMGMVSLLGNLLFAIGFALYGLMTRSAIERQEQLESMATAMADELQSLRKSGL